MPFLPILLAISAIAGTVGTVKSIKAQDRAAELNKRQESLANQRSRRQAIREYQIARATATAGAFASGAGGGSGVSGGIGGLTSQIGSDLGFGSQMSSLSGLVNNANRQANLYSGVAQIGATGFNLATSAGANPLGFLSALTPTAPGAPIPSASTTSAYRPPTGGSR